MVARICRPRGGGRTAFAALKRYVFQGSMRAPACGSSLGCFFEKVGFFYGWRALSCVPRYTKYAKRLRFSSAF